MKFLSLFVALLTAPHFKTHTLGAEAEPRFVVANARLPQETYDSVALYDGGDSVYVLGGLDASGVYQDKVLWYSIQADTLRVIGNFTSIYGGVAILHGSSIDYMGGRGPGGYSANIRRYSISTGSVNTVGQLPYATSQQALAWNPTAGVAYLFGGWGSAQDRDEVLEYDTRSAEVHAVSRLPSAAYAASGAWDSRSEVAYVFGGHGSEHQVTRFTPSSGVTEEVSTLLLPVVNSCSAYVETTGEVYIVGDNAILKFSPSTNQSQILQIESWPANLKYVACVHVPKLDRIYFFGGYGRLYPEQEPTSQVRDEVMYVQL